MCKQWLNSILILLAILTIFAIIGNLEKLPADAEYRLEQARKGEHFNKIIIAGK